MPSFDQAPERRRHPGRDAERLMARAEEAPHPDDLRVAVNALGTSWSTYQLYPDAAKHDAFVRAVGELEDAPLLGSIEVAPDSFPIEGSSPTARLPSADRLAHRLYAHGVTALRFDAPPRAEDLIGLFEVIRHDPAEVAEDGGVDEALMRLGILAIRAFARAPLTEDEREQDDPGAVADGSSRSQLEEYAGDSAALAHHLMRAAGDDPERLGDLVVESYGRAIAATRDDLWAHQEMVHTFVDTFFYFPTEHRAVLLGRLLERAEDPDYRMFLDQFARQELSELSSHLDPDVHPLLAGYAQIADTHRGSRLDELEGLLADEDGPTAATMVARRIEEVIPPETKEEPIPAGGAIERIVSQLVIHEDPTEMGRRVLQALVSLSTRSDAERRILRIWARKVAAAIEAGNPTAALSWLRSVRSDESVQRRLDAEEVLTATLGPNTLRHLVDAVDTDDEWVKGEAGTFVEEASGILTAPLIDLLGQEADASRRRLLIDMLGITARDHPGPVIEHLDDPRWYLVRNLVIVLGRCRGEEVVEALLPVASHPDDRVRREVLRALSSLLDDDDNDLFLAAVTDPVRTVRQVAFTILRSRDDAELVPALAAVLESRALTEAKTDVIEYLGGVGTSDARRVLEGYATSRFVVSSEGRALRSAAREVLGVMA